MVTALRVVWRPAMNRVRTGFKGGPGWDTEQFKNLMWCLVEAPHGACSADDLYSTLNMPGESAEAAVQAMAKANMLAFRPASGRQCAL